MNFTQNLTLDLNANNAYPVVSAKQGDSARYLNIYLTKDNIPYHIDESHQFYFRMRKPDGHGVLNPATVSFVRIQDEDINTTNSYVKVQLTEQILAVAGRGYADLVEYDNNGNVLSSVAFIVNVMAAPSIMSEVVSSPEFKELTDLVTEANSLIIESEKWARGTEHGVPADSEYEEVQLQNQSEFEQIKDFLYIKNGDEYELVTSDTFDPNVTYYTLTAGMENNSRYYSKQAENAWSNLVNVGATATATTAPDTQAVANVEYSSQNNSFDFTFKLPAGPQGERGPNTVFVSSEQPVAAIASQYDIWFNNEGEPEKFTISGNQVTYNADYSGYETNTVGKAIQDANTEINSLNDTIINLTPTLTSAVKDAQAAASEARQAAAGIENKIDNPTQGTTSGWYGYLKNEKTEDSSYKISWSSGIPYDDLINKPAIQGVTLVGDKTFGALNFQAWSSANLKASDLNYDDAAGSGGILPEYLNVGLKNTVALATTAVQEIIFNGESYTSTDGQPINLGYSVTTNNIVNKNYLDNSWFEINQRGTTSYPSVDSSIYICDRWKTITANKNRTIQIVDDGISIGTAPSDSATKGINFGQIIGDDVWQSLSGKNLHASVEFKIDGITDFIISDWDCVCPIYHTNDPTGSQKQFYNLGSGTPSPGWGAKLYSVSEQLIFSIIWQGTSWDINDEYTDVPITIRRVKLEVSNYSTLKQEPKPIYLDELTKCQKYFRQYGGQNYYSTGNVINVENTDTVIGIGIARSKRILDITMHGLGDMESPFSVAMPTGVVLQARRGFRAATTTYQPISVSVDQIKTYSYNPNATSSATLTEDFNFTHDSSTDTYTLATEYVAGTSYFRKVYKKGLGNTLLATIDITADASQYYPYYLVLPATASNAQEASWIQFSAEP